MKLLLILVLALKLKPCHEVAGTALNDVGLELDFFEDSLAAERTEREAVEAEFIKQLEKKVMKEANARKKEHVDEDSSSKTPC